ncbi:MAG: caspase family protein, partial [Rhodospirillales bacterium]|nr:caspase family protein [Rhodospirillales bacterium]
MRLLKPIAIFLFFIAILGIAGAAVAEKRVALIIGNGKYPRTIGALKNPPNDARLMAKTLRRLNFEVIETIDGSEKAMKKAIRAFGKRLDVAGKDGVGLFYYAGHGVQVKGLNYLIPIDAEIETEGDVDLSAINANSVLRMMEFSGSRLSFVILDACRNNPFARGFRSSSKGLARLEAPKGSLVAYATAPGNVAADGRGTNSPYTTALVRGLLSGQPVERMFREVRNTVMRTTREKQTPWESSSLTGGDFYFSPPKKTLTQTQTAALTPGPETKPAAPDV